MSKCGSLLVSSASWEGHLSAGQQGRLSAAVNDLRMWNGVALSRGCYYFHINGLLSSFVLLPHVQQWCLYIRHPGASPGPDLCSCLSCVRVSVVQCPVCVGILAASVSLPCPQHADVPASPKS
ncbi:hypothetical protein HJG60_010734 [Phyllostomus discolor]|uniref:Uncharacterized protein n=1 Tax=Phyllostomus discolor TaxID=89673 RepID=A0A834EA54_9CHIR|nr:hypothetical protein HJG60_010734 [Phyllostomus discolor]